VTPGARHPYRYPDLRRATKPEIELAMKGHRLANAELIGTYQKGGRDEGSRSQRHLQQARHSASCDGRWL
jgi:hypothetical protein